MKTRDWMLVFGLLLLPLYIDGASKLYAVKNFTQMTMHGPLGLVTHRNYGAMLGSFSDLPAILRIVTLCTGGAFLIFIYSVIQYLLPKRTMPLRIGLSILLSGILGNVIDRTINGSVIDFIVFNFGDWYSPVFNLADVFQWVGYAFIVYTVIFLSHELFPDKDSRKTVWVLPKFQRKYVFTLLLLGFCFSLISGVFAFTYLKITLEDIATTFGTALEKDYMVPFYIAFLSICGAFLLGLFIVGRHLSHRTAGPIYAFEKYLDDLIDGKDRPFKLRAGDELTHLEDIAAKVKEYIVVNQAVDNKISEKP